MDEEVKELIAVLIATVPDVRIMYNAFIKAGLTSQDFVNVFLAIGEDEEQCD